MNSKAFFSMSYGVYVTTTVDKAGTFAGCITNSNTQITSSPATVCVSVNHDNHTAKCIEESGLFGFTALAVDSNPEIIGKFGFSSSADTDKFSDFDYKVLSGVPIIQEGCSYVVCRVKDKLETNTHTVFLGEVIDADVLKTSEPMTYSYYHKVLKGKSPKKAPTYVEEETDSSKTAVKKFVCDICGYIYEGEKVPDDFICPICKADASHFKEQ